MGGSHVGDLSLLPEFGFCEVMQEIKAVVEVVSGTNLSQTRWRIAGRTKFQADRPAELFSDLTAPRSNCQ